MTHPLVAAARKYVGVPFRHMGRTEHALDCIGLGKLALRDCGFDPFVPRYYPREPHEDLLMKYLRDALGEPILQGAEARDESKLEPGDVGVFNFRDEPHHIALIGDAPYAGSLTLIHADSSPGMRRVVEHRLDTWWLERLRYVFRKAA